MAIAYSFVHLEVFEWFRLFLALGSEISDELLMILAFCETYKIDLRTVYCIEGGITTLRFVFLIKCWDELEMLEIEIVQKRLVGYVPFLPQCPLHPYKIMILELRNTYVCVYLVRNIYL